MWEQARKIDSVPTGDPQRESGHRPMPKELARVHIVAS